MNDKPKRAYLYCAKCPEGQIFEGAEIEQADADGWVDSPTKIESVIEITDEPATEGALAFHNPNSDLPEWPKQTDDGVWYDCNGAGYDPSKHSWPEGQYGPTVKKDGSFRKLPASK